MRTSVAMLCLLLAAGRGAAQPPAGDEQILDFQSDVRVRPDGTLTVTENIAVAAMGWAIKHGIYREFPTRYASPFGGRVVVPFTVLEVQRDGAAEPYRVENRSNGKRIVIGAAARLLSPGRHTYTIRYESGRQVGHFADHDELYWNVTGNGWAFPIAHAAGTVRLPDGIRPGDIATLAYTGPEGKRGHDYVVSVDPTACVSFQTTHPLAPKEGLTVVVRWPKGFVAEPTPAEQLEYFLVDKAAGLVTLGGCLLVGLFYLCRHVRAGRVPTPGPAVPESAPPEGLAPAAVRYVWRMGFDRACFTAAVVDMAVKGYLRIREGPAHQYELVRLPDGDPQRLSEDERRLGRALFSRGGRVAVRNDHRASFEAAIAAVKDSLATAYRGGYFVRRGRTFALGIGLSAAALVAAALVQGVPEVDAILVCLTGWSVGVAVLGAATFRVWRASRSGAAAAPRTAAGCMAVFAIPFFLGEAVWTGLLAWEGSWLLAAGLLALIGVNIFYYARWLNVPTEEGRRVMDRIAWFRSYLESGRAELSDGRDEQAIRTWFERYLPYAVALGVEGDWAAKFTGVIDAAVGGAAGAPCYAPVWYDGPGTGVGGWAAITTGFASSFSGAISSAASAPGSVAGDGGASGGGGGGGGGGGW